MLHSPDRKPLRQLTDRQLREMEARAASNVAYSLSDIVVERTYREQRRLAQLVAVFIGGTLVAHIAAIVLNAVL